MKPIVWTCGYEQHETPDSLAEALQEAGIELLVDVRELPLSRRQGFSKQALSKVLEDLEISYQSDRRLGNPKPYRDLYREGRQAEGEAGYLAHLRNGSTEAIKELARLVQGARVCLLCFERDHATCHRSILAEELRKELPRLRVKHL